MPADREAFLTRFVAAAIERTTHTVRYVPAYVRIPYPGGGVPADTGVCAGEIIRAYRAVGVDLQEEVHEDMVRNFSEYPRKWKWLSWRPDSTSITAAFRTSWCSSRAKAKLSPCRNRPEIILLGI